MADKRDYYEVLGLQKGLRMTKSKKLIVSFQNNIIQTSIKNLMQKQSLKRFLRPMKY